MQEKEDSRVWMFAGALGAVLISLALIPLRAYTAASNLAFVFLAFTIVVAELGGRAPAIITALVSALSLNFFLTEPYLTLRINKADDLIAFFALIVCGLIAAAFGRRRRSLSENLGQAGRELNVLTRVVDQLSNQISAEDILHDLKRSFHLGSMALRDEGGKIVAAVPDSPPGIAQTQLTPETLFPTDGTRHRLGSRGFRLPEDGGRVSLKTDRGLLSLDLWEGDSQGFLPEESRTLAAAVYLLLLDLARR